MQTVIRIGSVYIAMAQVQLTAKDTLKVVDYLPLAVRYYPLSNNLTYYIDLLYARKDFKTLETILPAYTKALKADKREETAAEFYTKLANLYNELKQLQKEYATHKNSPFTGTFIKTSSFAFCGSVDKREKI